MEKQAVGIDAVSIAVAVCAMQKNNQKCFTVRKVCMQIYFGTMLNSKILNI